MERLFFEIPSYEHYPTMCSTGLKYLAYNSGILAVIVVLILVGFLWAINKNEKLFEKIVNKSLSLGFAIVWLLGFLVYDVGMYTGEPWSLVGNAPMAIIHAFEAFLLQSEASAIHEPFHNNWVFMLFFSLTHFFAAMVSMIFVIKHFGFNIISAFRVFFHSIKPAPSASTTYVFWGMNDASFHLASSINSHYPEEDKKDYRIVVVRTNDDRETMIERNGMDRLFNFLSLKNKDYNRLKTLNCLTTSTYNDLSRISIPDDDQKTVDIIKGNLRLPSLSRIIRNKTTEELHVFFLSDDQQYNIQAISNLRKDDSICSFAAGGHKVKFYCHARYNSINRVFEDIDPSTNMDVRIIDSSHLSIECLKRVSPNNITNNYQPVRFVDIDKTNNYGTVSSTFTSLIVGFGETGKDALRYLYEFGTFVDSKSTPTETRRSKFRCHIVDRDLDKMKGSIMNGSPNLFSNKNPQDDSLLVELHAIDFNTDEFFNQLLKGLSKDLNYVVIALGSDEISITLAVRILKYMRRCGRKFDKLRIFVRLYDSSVYPQMKRIADHFNKGEERIVLFGRVEDIYSYDLVVCDEFELRGREYYDSYRRLNPEHDEDGTWDQRRKKLMRQVTLERTNTDPITGCSVFEEVPLNVPQQPSIDDLQKLRRKESQDKANALHELTKMYLLQTVVPNWYIELVPQLFKNVQIENLTFMKVNRTNSFVEGKSIIVYPELSQKQQKLMENLAKLEHLRWNASHEVLGYTTMPDSVPNENRGCDESTVTHNCLIPWEKLDAETEKISYIPDYKIFDYGVVETTIDIMRRTYDERQKSGKS
jgi:hypothetical protein